MPRPGATPTGKRAQSPMTRVMRMVTQMVDATTDSRGMPASASMPGTTKIR